MSDRNDERSSPRGDGGSGASPFCEFSSFREMILDELEASRAERQAAEAEARVERETAAAEQRRLMAEVFELKLQLVEERRSLEVNPGLLGRVGSPEVLSKVLLLEATVSPTFAAQLKGSSSDVWIGDSDASCHMTDEASKMYCVRPLLPDQREVITSDGTRLRVECVGKFYVVFPGGSDEPITLCDVSYVPNLRFNLFHFIRHSRHMLLL